MFLPCWMCFFLFSFPQGGLPWPSYINSCQTLPGSPFLSHCPIYFHSILEHYTYFICNIFLMLSLSVEFKFHERSLFCSLLCFKDPTEVILRDLVNSWDMSESVRIHYHHLSPSLTRKQELCLPCLYVGTWHESQCPGKSALKMFVKGMNLKMCKKDFETLPESYTQEVLAINTLVIITLSYTGSNWDVLWPNQFLKELYF